MYMEDIPIKKWRDIKWRYHRGTILLGNGASMAVSSSFGYESLLEHAIQKKFLEEDVLQLFDVFYTKDFELILRLVWQASNVNRALGILNDNTHLAYANVRDCLIRVVQDVHPEYFAVQNKLPSMYSFLKQFDTVLSLNYDLLVYWVMSYGFDTYDGHSFKDCFNSGVFDDDWRKFRKPYRESTVTLVFYPHGNLLLCRDIVEEEYKIHSRNEGNLLQNILNKWRSEKCVPLFVSEGMMRQKILSIHNSYYLSTIYREVIASQRSTLTILGWGIGEHDKHLLLRMKDSGIQQVAVSVFNKNQRYCRHAFEVIKECLGNVHIDFFDSESPGCWIHEEDVFDNY